MIRRPPRSTRVRSSAASDVYKRQEPFIADQEHRLRQVERGKAGIDRKGDDAACQRHLLVLQALTPASPQDTDSAPAGGAVGSLFGRECYGLQNEEVALASRIITFPVNPGFASLNLAQAVLLIGYEWFKLKTAGALPFA